MTADPALAMLRRERLGRSRLYVVTGARQARGDLSEFLEAILEAGVDIVQLREKEAEAGRLLRWGEAFREAAHRHRALFVVNDRPDVALALDADGVHLGQDDLPVGRVRDLFGPDLLIGLSTHGVEQLRAVSGDTDYLSVGPIHPTPTKEGRPAIGLGPVRVAGQEERRPWFGIGGIDVNTVSEVVEAGATRIVVVRAVTEAPDPAEAVRVLLSLLPPLAAA
jgi:thiamine-phosphate pyrophosphorylase